MPSPISHLVKPNSGLAIQDPRDSIYQELNPDQAWTEFRTVDEYQVGKNIFILKWIVRDEEEDFLKLKKSSFKSEEHYYMTSKVVQVKRPSDLQKVIYSAGILLLNWNSKWIE